MLLLEPEMEQALSQLEQLLLGGEALPIALVQQLSKVVVGEIHNLYGPTETTIWSTTHKLEDAETTRPHTSSVVPLGHPVASTEVYILDKHLQLLPIGVPGELYIGGEGVVRGYLNRPDLTAERFIPHPYARPEALQGGARLYRTGDLARCRSDGTLEYLGRIDQQIKLRGYRIELGEIEATLRTYPGVQEAVVLLQEEDASRKYLVAYVVGVGLAPALLQDSLRERLPEYMVPTIIVELESLPLLPNGKINRHALPPVDQATRQSKQRQGPASVGVKSLTPLQELLGAVWKEVLHLAEVDLEENFFALGGHSLLVTQVVARLREVLGVDVPLRSLFEAPTLERFALLVEGVMSKASSGLVPTLVPMQRRADLPLSFAQERLWFLAHWQQDSGWYNVPIALRLCGPLHVRALEQSLLTVVQRHESLRTIFSNAMDARCKLLSRCRQGFCHSLTCLP
jgi:hypothetical protein